MNNEEVRRNVLFAVEITTALILLSIAASSISADVRRQIMMRGYRIIARSAKRGANKLSHVATAADTAYWRCTNVTI